VQRNGNILVIDQDPTTVALLIEILTDAGYVAYAASPREALAAIVRYPPALILLDMRMPSRGGAALLAQVREGGAANLPIVVMTTAPREAASLLIAEVIEVLAKPFELDDLLDCVARYVQPIQAVDQR
jgi:CheY-like chemotaxis protein